MADYRLTLVAVMVVLCSVCIQNSSAITCYECRSSSMDSNSCGGRPTNTVSQGSFLNGTTADCASCFITVYSGDSFDRGCVTGTQTNGCSVTTGGTRCFCNSNYCNNQPVKYNHGTVQCYECQSMDFTDTGCGATVDSTSVYVRKISGCTACFKAVSQSAGGGIYTRGCLYDESSDDECAASAAPLPPCTFRCESNLCNTATTLTTKRFPILLAVVCAVYGVCLL